MPVTRGAIKKLRQDKKRQIQNALVKKAIHDAFKKLRISPTPKNLSEVYSLIDTAKKKKIFHSNKTNRLKANANKLLKNKPIKKTLKIKSEKK